MEEQSTSDQCPLCSTANASDALYTTWLQCDACNTWYHAECLKISARECDQIEQYHCHNCIATHGPTTYKPAPRTSSRERTRLNYADLNDGKTADEKIWGKMLRVKTFDRDHFRRYKGDQVTLSLLRKTGMREPFVVPDPEGLDMVMPPSDLTVHDIADAVGRDKPVEVMDVATQSESPGWTMDRWANYYHNPEKDRIRNVISLEISGTPFAKDIVRPRIVRELDWIDHMWPEDLKPKEYPKVQLYCLMGTKDSYTDFHIDFGGSSVFYHILRGSKIFYFIEPTSKNLKKYQKWSSSPDQSTIFFGDEVKHCYAVQLFAGNTMIIPTGWIHAVYTPEDAIVIGGNFLHGLNISTQLRIHDIEEITQVPLKFRFPHYYRMNYYAALRYADLLEDDQHKFSFSHFELEGIAALAQWIHKQSDHDQALASRLVEGVQRVVAHLLPPRDTSSQSVKVKLKLGEQAVKTETQPSPKIVLKINAQEDSAAVDNSAADEDFVLEEDEFLSEDEGLGSDTEDEEYEQDEPEEKPKPVRRKRTNAKTSKRKAAPPDESSSEDEMGPPQKRQKARRPAPARSMKKTPPTTVKQRLLVRMIKAKHS